MSKYLIIFSIFFGSTFYTQVLANDFGSADFLEDFEDEGAKSYHDAWCRHLGKTCRVRFQGRIMWVEGFRGIDRSQLISFRFKRDGGKYGQNVHGEKYFYVRYRDSSELIKTALFLFSDNVAAQEFGVALARWYDQDSRPIPNFRLPASQGPQDTQGRDKGNNPYEKPPITDRTKKTTK